MCISHESVNRNRWKCLHEQFLIVHAVLEKFQTIAQQPAKRKMSNYGLQNNCYKIWHMFVFVKTISKQTEMLAGQLPFVSAVLAECMRS